ncbi:MAG: KpsF/GutQ family sugar-phosphate isomerase [Kiloniellales bacterium]
MSALSPDPKSTLADGKRDLEAAQRVLKIEADALAALSRSLDSRLGRVLDVLEEVAGRVVVTGMGKSGHVARKIAATLASTGTPAIYVHPGEASHGDLGMITRSDGVLALSNSGNTAELSDIIAHCKRYGIPLLALTSRADSTLAEAADPVLLLPQAPEACPMGLAPTTSTTMMLALGDAIAIALLERRGFSMEDFQHLHPGGALGRRLLRVAEVMHGTDELPLCRTETPMAEAILVMTRGRFGCVGVIDEGGRLIGIVTDGDLRRHMSAELLDRAAGDVMTRTPQTIRAQALAAEALALMNAAPAPKTCLFVVAEEQRGPQRPIGIVHIHDCLRAGLA